MLVVPFRVQNSGLGTCPLGVFSLSRCFCGTSFKLIEIYDDAFKTIKRMYSKQYTLSWFSRRLRKEVRNDSVCMGMEWQIPLSKIEFYTIYES